MKLTAVRFAICAATVSAALVSFGTPRARAGDVKLGDGKLQFEVQLVDDPKPGDKPQQATEKPAPISQAQEKTPPQKQPQSATDRAILWLSKPAGDQQNATPKATWTYVIREADEKPEAGEKSDQQKAELHKRMLRQHELAERAWQVYRNLEAMGNDDSEQSRSLRKELSQVENELRQALMQLPMGGNVIYTQVPGMPAPPVALPGAPGGAPSNEARPVIIRLAEAPSAPQDRVKSLQAEVAKLAELSQHLSRETHELQEAVERVARAEQRQALNRAEIEKPELRQLQDQLEVLRQKMEELRQRSR